MKYSYTVITNLVSVLCESQLPRFKELVAQRTFEKTTLAGGFFVFRARDYGCNARISRRS
ncbi:hypothetical protein A4I13_23680 [Salmonella enterica]|nr:hypothetical protein [Salmonella enterica]EGT5209091.1 hypothetical protein [Cronobacter sakazakii]ECJ6441609.1 hypothetical protein [Salmonella enterica]ECJ6446192.1 hypothetical protein [Salmonella enterica]EGT5755678.1 hypothetical protein [Cronobacter sakazakii]